MRRLLVATLLLIGVNVSYAQDSEDVRILIESYLALVNAEESRRIAEEIIIGANGEEIWPYNCEVY